MLKLYVFLLALTMAQAVKISPSVNYALETKDKIDIMVTMREKTFTVLNPLNSQRFKTRKARLNAVANSLKTLAAKSQKSVLEYLNTKSNIKVTNLWISNKISVKGVNAELVNSLATLAQVESVNMDRVIPWKQPRASKRVPAPAPKAPQWGINTTEAPAAWDLGYTGAGVVVAIIDTGARYTHNNLYGNWRKQYGWFDPYDGNLMPVDENGHGTHTVGTIAGSDGIGVAPDAQWIACIGCSGFGCSHSSLELCGQFMACPTHANGTEAPDCSYAPHLVSNSWGVAGGDPFYEEVVAAWQAGGIIPIFPIGNTGDFCGNAASPGDYPNVIGVGATDVNEKIGDFSSVGPADDGRIKPDIVAPGVDVISASNEADDEFQSKSGTSMACPHAAGVVALLLSKDAELTYLEASELLIAGAQHTIADSGANCGGIPETEYPNNRVGYGRISALASLTKLREIRSKN